MRTRRELLRSASVGAAGIAGVSGLGHAQSTDTETGEAQIYRRFVTPEFQAFVGDYQGQFLFIDEPTDERSQEVDIGTCPVADWDQENIQVYSAQLLDRRQEEPLTVDIEAFGNDEKPQITPSSYFIINDVGHCGGDYVDLGCEWVRRRSLVGKPPGPTVSDAEEEAPGFGLVSGALGIAGGLAFAAYRWWS